MRCPDEGLLRTYVDRELPARQEEELARHLRTCGECRDRLAEVERTGKLVASRLALLSPSRAEQPAAPAVALATVRRRAALRPTWRDRLKSRLTGGLSMPRAVGVAASLALVLALAVTPVGGAAQDLLKVFRVQQVAPIQIDASVIPALPEPADLGTLTMTAEPKLELSNLSDAGKAAGITPRTVRQLPSGFSDEPVVLVSQPAEGAFTYDLAKIRAYYQERGLQGEPPAELDGLTVRGKMPAAVVSVYGDQAAIDGLSRLSAEDPHDGPAIADPASVRFLVLAQGRSPELEVPDGVDLDSLRDKLLASGALPPELAAQLGSLDNWESTLPLPVLKGTSREVTVEGVPGVLVTGDEHGRYLVWQKDGLLNAVFGTVSEDELIEAANSLQ